LWQRKLPILAGAAAIGGTVWYIGRWTTQRQMELSKWRQLQQQRETMFDTSQETAYSNAVALLGRIHTCILQEAPLPSTDDLRSSLSSSREEKVTKWLEVMQGST